jgi:hypothetical protein
MIQIRPSRLAALIDRLKGRYLVLAAIVITVLFAAAYWRLSRSPASNGLIGPESGADISFADSLYFSIVTEATLGYGDFRPVGLSRFLACSQVFLGLLVAGIAIAKINSLPGRELRLASRNATGDWIEVNKVDGNVFLTFARISFDGSLVRYDGENFGSEGDPFGFFKSEMIEINDTVLRFRYSNRDSDTQFFDEGVCNMHFVGDGGAARWMRYHGTAHDFGRLKKINYEGVRASDEECKIIHGSDVSAKKQLVRQHLSKCSGTVGPSPTPT